MGAFAVLLMTTLWGFVGIAMPILSPKGPHHSIIKCILMLTAATCWLFWLCCFMHQMNPLIGPRLHQTTILMIAREWGELPTDLNTYKPINPNGTESNE